MTQNPEMFQLCVDIFVKRYASMDIDAIAGLDARGFVLGTPIALALKKPFVMIRKAGKLPNSVSGSQYYKEYTGSNATGGDELCISRTAIKPGNRVLVIDDLVATGVRCVSIIAIHRFLLLSNVFQGTLIAACDLLRTVGAEIVECACMVELKMLGGYEKLRAKHPDTKVWGMISEDILLLEGEAPPQA